MVEITLPIMLQIVQTVALLVGIIYYLFNMRNAQRNQKQAIETRQAQLFYGIYNRMSQSDFVDALNAFYTWEYTNLDELRKIREILGNDIPLLIPGIGKQGGDIEKTVKFGTNKDGNMAIINSSRGIIFSGNDRNFSKRARDAAHNLKEEINKYRYYS